MNVKCHNSAISTALRNVSLYFDRLRVPIQLWDQETAYLSFYLYYGFFTHSLNLLNWLLGYPNTRYRYEIWHTEMLRDAYKCLVFVLFSFYFPSGSGGGVGEGKG